MRNLKLKIRNAVTFLLGDILQNQDNNFSSLNQLENEIMTDEFNFYRDLYSELNLVENQLNTFRKIKQYVAKMDKIKDEEELRKQTAKAYIKYKEAGFIDDNFKLLKYVDEAITEFIS